MRGRLLFARINLDSFADHRLRLFDQCGNAPTSARNAYEKSKNDDCWILEVTHFKKLNVVKRNYD